MCRWCAPEVIQKRKYSTQSDIWSFGMTMWEIFSFGTFPFFDSATSAAVLNRIMANQLPTIPSSCADPVYKTILKCWARVPSQRINWKDLVKELQDDVDKVPLNNDEKKALALYE
jgi:serine/threonine protein kinase